MGPRTPRKGNRVFNRRRIRSGRHFRSYSIADSPVSLVLRPLLQRDRSHHDTAGGVAQFADSEKSPGESIRVDLGRGLESLCNCSNKAALRRKSGTKERNGVRAARVTAVIAGNYGISFSRNKRLYGKSLYSISPSPWSAATSGTLGIWSAFSPALFGGPASDVIAALQGAVEDCQEQAVNRALHRILAESLSLNVDDTRH